MALFCGVPTFFSQFFSIDNDLSYIFYLRLTSFYNFLCTFLGQILNNTNYVDLIQKNLILTILTPKCDPLLPYPGHESQKINFFYFYNNSVQIVLPNGNFLVLWYVLEGEMLI